MSRIFILDIYGLTRQYNKQEIGEKVCAIEMEQWFYVQILNIADWHQ